MTTSGQQVVQPDVKPARFFHHHAFRPGGKDPELATGVPSTGLEMCPKSPAELNYNTIASQNPSKSLQSFQRDLKNSKRLIKPETGSQKLSKTLNAESNPQYRTKKQNDPCPSAGGRPTGRRSDKGCGDAGARQVPSVGPRPGGAPDVTADQPTVALVASGKLGPGYGAIKTTRPKSFIHSTLGCPFSALKVIFSLWLKWGFPATKPTKNRKQQPEGTTGNCQALGEKRNWPISFLEDQTKPLLKID